MRKALSAIAIASILMIALAFAGCTTQQGGTTNPTTNPTANPGTGGNLPVVIGAGSEKIDFSKASWWSWKVALNDLVTTYKLEHSEGTYNGEKVRKCKLHIVWFDGTLTQDLEYYYNANKDIVYAKRTEVTDLGALGKTTEVIEVPEGARNTTDEARDVISDIKDSDPIYDSDGYGQCKPAGNEQVTIAKGTFNCQKFDFGTPLADTYMAYWLYDQAPTAIKKYSTTKVLGPETAVTYELIDWG